jgi:transcription elongation factor GreA
MADPIILTPEAVKELENELLERTTKQRETIATELEESRAAGDLSENSWHDSVIEKRDQNEKRISEIEEMIRTAKVVQPQDDAHKVTIGMSFEVEVEDDDTKEKTMKSFTMVVATQANPLEGKLSNDSPIGKILMGKKEGESVEFTQPNGKKMIYHIQKFL